MVRLLMFLALLIMLLSQLLDRVYLRPSTAARAVQSVSVKEGSVHNLVMETQEIVNTSSVRLFSDDALVSLFNFRPGQAVKHVDSPEIRGLFINDDYFNRFRNQFLVWARHEFQVNNISIKEAIVTEAELTRTPFVSMSGARIWRYSAVIPVYDRGVGDSDLTRLKVRLSIVYLGPEGGMGIYAVKISL